jgi:hypothetical protein
LIDNTGEIAGKFEILEPEDLQKLLKNLEYVYDIVHQFNMNIQRRFDLFKKIDLRASHDKVPILLKHEIKSLEIYFAFLKGLYKNSQENTESRKETVEIILKLCIKVLKEFASNFEKMLHLDRKPPSEKKREKYGQIAMEEAVEEMKRLLFSTSFTISNSVLKTLMNMDGEDLAPYHKKLTPILIDCVICDQYEFNVGLKEVLKKILIEGKH